MIRHIRLRQLGVIAALLIGTMTFTALPAPAAPASTVELLVFGYDATTQAWATKTMANFNSSHKSIKLKITVVPPDQMQQLLTTRVQGGTPPDIASAPTAWVPSFAAAGVLTDWSTVVSPALVRSFNANLLSGSKFNGKLYSLPYLSSARALFYNKDHFEAAGISTAPKTWEELVTQAATLNTSGQGKFPLSLQGTGNEAFAAWFPYFYWSYGGSFDGPNGKITIAQPACVKALTVLNTLIQTKATEPNPTSFDITEQLGAFTSGDAAMTVSGPWLVGMSKGVNFGVAPLPGGTVNTTLGVTDGWIQFKKSKNASKAAEVMKYLFTPSIADAFVEGRGMLPTLTSGFKAARYQSGPLKQFVSMLSNAKFVPLSPNWAKLSTQGAKALQDMYVNGAAPQAVCSNLAKIAGS